MNHNYNDYLCNFVTLKQLMPYLTDKVKANELRAHYENLAKITDLVYDSVKEGKILGNPPADVLPKLKQLIRLCLLPTELLKRHDIENRLEQVVPKIFTDEELSELLASYNTINKDNKVKIQNIKNHINNMTEDYLGPKRNHYNTMSGFFGSFYVTDDVKKFIKDNLIY